MSCWSCSNPPGDGAFCASCGKIQPGRPRDPFAVLGLGAPRFHLDEATLEKAWRDLSRKLHPDKFAKADAKERRFSLEQTTILNDARKTLKNPVKRAEHLFRSEGLAVLSDEAGTPGAGSRLPLEFYEEVMEDREALLEAKTEGPDAVRTLADRITARRTATLATVDAAFTAWEKGGGKAALEPAVVELAKLRYFDRFLDEVEGKPHD